MNVKQNSNMTMTRQGTSVIYLGLVLQDAFVFADNRIPLRQFGHAILEGLKSAIDLFVKLTQLGRLGARTSGLLT